jgi:hypothetical protein
MRFDDLMVKARIFCDGETYLDYIEEGPAEYEIPIVPCDGNWDYTPDSVDVEMDFHARLQMDFNNHNTDVSMQIEGRNVLTATLEGVPTKIQITNMANTPWGTVRTVMFFADGRNNVFTLDRALVLKV